MTWGTKQLTEQSTDLGIVKSVAGEGDSVEVILPTDQAAIGQLFCPYWDSLYLTPLRLADSSYDEALIALKTRPKIIPAAKTAAEKDAMKQDYYRDIRSNVSLGYCKTVRDAQDYYRRSCSFTF